MRPESIESHSVTIRYSESVLFGPHVYMSDLKSPKFTLSEVQEISQTRFGTILSTGALLFYTSIRNRSMSSISSDVRRPFFAAGSR